MFFSQILKAPIYVRQMSMSIGGVLVGCSIFSCIVARAAGSKLNSLHGSLVNKYGEKDLTKVRQAFFELDHDNSGALDTTELALVATSLGAGESQQGSFVRMPVLFPNFTNQQSSLATS